MIEKCLMGWNDFAPFKAKSSIRKEHPINSPFNFLTSSIDALTVPPVANRSSKISTLAPGLIALICNSRASTPYSKLYSALTVS